MIWKKRFQMGIADMNRIMRKPEFAAADERLCFLYKYTAILYKSKFFKLLDCTGWSDLDRNPKDSFFFFSHHGSYNFMCEVVKP